MGKGEEHLIDAVKSQDLPLVQKILNKGRGKLLGSSKKVNINYQDGEGFSALHHATMCGHTELVCILVDAGATVDINDKKGMRPIHYAAWKGKFQVVAALLQSGSSCSYPSVNGCAPLHLAAQYGHIPVCKILVQYGANVSSRRSDGDSPFDLACEFGRAEVVDLFLHNSDSGALMDQLLLQKSGGDFAMMSSPLHLAAKNGHTSIVRLLLQAGVDINWRTTSGTCLHEAVSNEKPEIVQLLIDCGIDTNQRSGLGQTALELAKKLPKSPPIMEIIRKLTEVHPRFVQVYATTDFNNILDDSSLAFTKGTVITVLEQNSNGIWKGRIGGANGRSPCVGTFPASFVQPYHQTGHNSNMAGSDDSGIHPHDEEGWTPSNTPLHHHPPQRGRVPSTKPHQMPHKYVNVDPRNPATPPHLSKVTLVNANVNNPSYDDVICTQQTKPNGTYDRPITVSHSNIDRPITVSRFSQEGSLTSPHITNPGYEDVLLDQTSCSSTNTASSYTSSASGRIRRTSESSHSRSHVIGSSDNRSSGSMDSINSKQSISSEMDEQVYRWLRSFGMEQYTSNFLQHGYDLSTIARASPADLTAIRISKPPHRKKLANQVSLLRKESPPSPQIDELPHGVPDWLAYVGLPEYTSVFSSHNVDSIEKVVHTTWEDLQEMHIEKLGHQKKLILAITKLDQAYRRAHDRHHASSHSQRSTNPYHNPPPLSINSEHLQANRLKKAPVPGSSTKPFSSFKEAPDLSLELQKALNKRQKIIDDDVDQTNRVKASSNGGATHPPNGGATHPPKPNMEILDRPAVDPLDIASFKNGPPPPKSSKSHFTPQVKHPSPLSHPPKEHNFRRTSSCRGPPPNPPKRTTSACMDDMPPLDGTPLIDEKGPGMSVKSIAAMMGNTQNGERFHREVGKVPASSASSGGPASGGFKVSPHSAPPPSRHTPPMPLLKSTVTSPSDVTSVLFPIKPAVAAKPKPAAKPAVMKKPQLLKPQNPSSIAPICDPEDAPVARATMTYNTTSTSVVKKTSHEEPGKHFDLSVLDKIDRQNQVSKSQDEEEVSGRIVKPPPVIPVKPFLKRNIPSASSAMSTTNEFTLPQRTLSDVPDSAPFIGGGDFSDEFEFPAPPPSMLDPPLMNEDVTSFVTSKAADPTDLPPPPSLPSTGELRMCFEADEDTGTVKRRPPSVSTKDEDEVVSPLYNSTKHPKSTDDDIQPADPPQLPKKESEVDKPPLVVPPPIPKKTLPKGQSSLDIIPPITTDLSETTSEGNKTQQMLDDIGSMFDDLVQEFDDILN